MRQVVYISSVRAAAAVDPEGILRVSRVNNARDQVTGLLFFNGKRFLQALEGEDAAVRAVMARIEADRRHHAIVILSDRVIALREFGDWAMAYRTSGAADQAALSRISALARGASPTVRSTFESFAQIRAAA